jgi:aminoglycoside phosphotransferase (APT) family kinase protein
MSSPISSPVGSLLVEPDAPTDALRRLGISPDTARWTPLTGGVSSDIWRVDLPNRTVCVKRARPVLAVAAEWHAPVERSESEVAWLEVVGGIDQSCVPRVLGHLPDAHLFVMEHLDPAEHPVWKSELSAGRVDIGFARDVGSLIGTIHARTAGSGELAERFATDDLFASLRLEPYFGAAADAHPDLADQLGDITERTATTRLTLVHGDVSPKNILVGPDGPVFLDAECAWFGDPAFDTAFCLTHLLLKCLWAPAAGDGFLESFDTLFEAYRTHVDWEPIGALEARVATLLPALLLARVDGKSPVEYLTADNDRDIVRGVTRDLIAHPITSVTGVRDAWKASLA